MELILRVCAEGGEIALYGTETTKGWVFQRCVADQTPLLIDEPTIEHESGIARSWDEAIRLMDEYRWHRLSPRSVHPEFQAQVWDEITRRVSQGLVSEYRFESWREVCAPPPWVAL